MSETLTGTARTLLVTAYLRAVDARSARPVLGDPYAVDLLARLDVDEAAYAAGRANAPVVAARGAWLDRRTQTFLDEHPDGQVLHLGAGLDSRPLRLRRPVTSRWVDVDRAEVVALRRDTYDLPDDLVAVAASVSDAAWWEQVEHDRPTLIVAEGLSMYLSPRTCAPCSYGRPTGWATSRSSSTGLPPAGGALPAMGTATERGHRLLLEPRRARCHASRCPPARRRLRRRDARRPARRRPRRVPRPLPPRPAARRPAAAAPRGLARTDAARPRGCRDDRGPRERVRRPADRRRGGRGGAAAPSGRRSPTSSRPVTSCASTAPASGRAPTPGSPATPTRAPGCSATPCGQPGWLRRTCWSGTPSPGSGAGRSPTGTRATSPAWSSSTPSTRTPTTTRCPAGSPRCSRSGCASLRDSAGSACAPSSRAQLRDHRRAGGFPAVPLRVLTPDSPPVNRLDARVRAANLQHLHQREAAASPHGSHHVVEGSSHLMYLDQPHALADHVAAVADAGSVS